MDIVRKLLAVGLILCLCLTACGKSAKDNSSEKGTTSQETLESEDSTIATEDAGSQSPDKPEDSSDTTEDINVIDNGTVSNYGYTIPELNFATKNIPDTEAMRFAQDMNIGWNLGNTFDSSVDQPWFEGELEYESAWCGVKTTPEMIKAVKDAGFDTIRIPVSWHNHVSYDGNYYISEEWMTRVKEVVDYAISLDMYVILNTHHDIYSGSEEGSLGQCFIYPSEEYYEESTLYLTAVWTQISNTFKDYDEHLIFESMNEPRLTGTDYEWWLDPTSSECEEAVECINGLNQTFVDVVRSSGGNNANRYLLIPGYCSSFDGATHSSFTLPVDTVEDRLMVVVHAYTPYNFALQSPTEGGSKNTFDVNNSSDTQEIDYIMNTLYERYISKGIPVIIDEFGARNKPTDNSNENTQARINFTAYYVAKARANGITCCWWDNNSFNSTGEDYGLLNRSALMWVYPDIIQAMMKY